MNKHMDKRMDRHMDKRMDRHMDKRMDRHMDKHMDKRMDKHKDKHKDSGVITEIGDVRDLIGILDIEDGLSDLNLLFMQKNRIRPPEDALAGAAETSTETSITEQGITEQDIMKSLVVTTRGVFLSPVSTAALRRRLEHDARIYG